MEQLLFRDDADWIAKSQELGIHDREELTSRLRKAFLDHPDPLSNENTVHAIYTLSNAGLIVEQSDNAWSLPHFLCASLLNYSLIHQQPCFHKFFLELSAEPAVTIRIPARSHLLLHRLAYCLKIDIYLFSSRKKAILFAAEDAMGSIGLFHRVDSYDQVGEFLVLAPSRISMDDTHTSQPRTRSSAATDILPAVFRNEERKQVPGQQGIGDMISQDEARSLLRAAW